MTSWPATKVKGARARWAHYRNNQRVLRYQRMVSRAAPAAMRGVVLIFNASTRLSGLSLNAGFALVSGWMLKLAGYRVRHLFCDSGLSRCVLGTNRDDPAAPMPCRSCTWQSTVLAASSESDWFDYQLDPDMAATLQGMPLQDLMIFEHHGVRLGELVLPTIRWVLRRHNLIDDAPTLTLYREYILSAWNLRRAFLALLEVEPIDQVVVFNGMFYPEATLRSVCRERGIRCVSHEVGLQPMTAYFTDGDATAYPIDIPADFQMSAEQNAKLDAYLAKRFQGDFSMAGIQFWPQMQPLPEDFWQKAAQFEGIVPVFTNVIFDTSQSHANVIFTDMFDWLSEVARLIEKHPHLYFVIRAHPDELRSGKASRESVSDWVVERGIDRRPNVLFVPPQQTFSSYELINQAKLVMVYNSTIGLEAALMGRPVLCAGKARFTQIPTVFFPSDRAGYQRMAGMMLAAEGIEVPESFMINARKFLYYQLFKTSLPFSDFLAEDGIWPGYVNLRPFEMDSLRPENSATAHAILSGISLRKDFILHESA